MYITYITRNLITGEFYIGSHKLDGDDDTYLGSGKLLRDSIAKYGPENFVRETIASFDTREESVKLEHDLIKQKRQESLCLNMSNGGNSFDYINMNLQYDRASFGAMASHDYAVQQRELHMEDYLNHPNYCMQCHSVLPYEKRHNKFCDSSCAASYNNVRRPRRKDQRFCILCGKPILNRGTIFCSRSCASIYGNAKREQTEKRKMVIENKSIIESLHNSGQSYRQIAQQYDVSANFIKNLLKGRLQ